MLNDEGNSGERWKQQWIQLAKKQLCTCSTLFLFISLPLFWTTTMWNFQKLLSSMFYGGNVVRVIVHFFFTAAHFHLALMVASISHFFTTTTKFSCCSPNKKCLLCFFIWINSVLCDSTKCGSQITDFIQASLFRPKFELLQTVDFTKWVTFCAISICVLPINHWKSDTFLDKLVILQPFHFQPSTVNLLY